MIKLENILIILSLILLTACSSEKWDGFIYPDQNNLTQYKHIGTFLTLEECRSRAVAELNVISSIDKGDYECGLNCRVNDHGLYICKKTSH